MEEKKKQETEGRNEEINQPFEWKNRTAEEMNERIKQHPEWEIITSVYHLPELTEEEKQKSRARAELWSKYTDEEIRRWLETGESLPER